MRCCSDQPVSLISLRASRLPDPVPSSSPWLPTLTTEFQQIGTHQIRMTYSGDQFYNGSGISFNQEITSIFVESTLSGGRAPRVT